MVKILRLTEKTIGYALVAVCFIVSVLAIIGQIDKDTVVDKQGWIMFLYLAAIIVVIYKTASFFFASFYQARIDQRKAEMHSMAVELSKEIAVQNQSRVDTDSLMEVIDSAKQIPASNTDALMAMLKERLPEVVQELVDKQVAEIRRNLEKEYEERMREIRFLSAGISDVIDRRNYCLDIEKKIKEHQEEERKNRLALTLEYSMLVFSLVGSSVEDVEKVCDVVKLFVETGHVSANKDLLIPLNKKLRNPELKQFVSNIMKYNQKENLDGDSFLQTAFGEWFSGKKENIAKNYSVLPKDSLVSKDGLEADLVRLRNERLVHDKRVIIKVVKQQE